jgi:hypothetical protein
MVGEMMATDLFRTSSRERWTSSIGSLSGQKPMFQTNELCRRFITAPATR